MGMLDEELEELEMLQREMDIFKKLPKEDVIFLINRGKNRENSAVEVLLESCLDYDIITKEQLENIYKVWDELKKFADSLEEEKEEEAKDDNEDYSDAEDVLGKALRRFSNLS